MEVEEPEALEVVAVGGGLGEEDSGEEEGDSAGATEDHHCSGLILDCIVTIICAIFIDFHVNFCKILFIYALEVLYVENIHIYVEWIKHPQSLSLLFSKCSLVSQNNVSPVLALKMLSIRFLNTFYSIHVLKWMAFKDTLHLVKVIKLKIIKKKKSRASIYSFCIC